MGVARFTILLTALLLWPQLPGVPSDMLNTAILACEYTIAALSLVLLIGLVGQISLCQSALIGMGAFAAALMTNKLGMHFPWTLLVGLVAGAGTATLIGVVALRVRGLYLAVATLIFAYVCDQYLFNQTWLVQNQSGTSIGFESIGKAGTIPYFNLGNVGVFYYVALAVALLTLYSVANLRDSRLGRAFAAIRGSEVAAASLGINVTRFKLLGFACAGALAGLGGALTLVAQRTVAPSDFNFTNSLYFLAIAVVGGLRSLGGAVASSILFAVLVGEVFFRSPTLADYLDVISSGMLITVLLFFRGGLGMVPERLPRLRSALARALRPVASLVFPNRTERDGAVSARPHAAPAPVRVVTRSLKGGMQSVCDFATSFGRRKPAQIVAPAAAGAGPLDIVGIVHRLSEPGTTEVAPQLRVEHFDRPQEEPNAVTDLPMALMAAALREGSVAGEPGDDGRRYPVLLSARGITVQFGGLTAVNNASLQVGAGEIVGLIGPNGAGKTTLFNSILGLNRPTAGHIALFDHDVTAWDVHRRAALGVGRTFQVLQLFSDLTVFDNLLIATHLQNSTGLWGSLVVSSSARGADNTARERVRAVLKLMHLEQFANRRVQGLPFGVLRLVEVARTLVTGARLVCFDEPASGLDSSETERLIEWFRFLRQVGITLLVIEHDVDMVVRLCDYIYVLEQGRLLASGPPAQIQRDPAVIASYLGAPMEVA